MKPTIEYLYIINVPQYNFCSIFQYIQIPGLVLPGKTAFKNTNKEFLEKRRKGLDAYLQVSLLTITELIHFGKLKFGLRTHVLHQYVSHSMPLPLSSWNCSLLKPALNYWFSNELGEFHQCFSFWFFVLVLVFFLVYAFNDYA